MLSSGVKNLILRRKVATATPFTPASLGASLLAWYKADAGVYKDAGSTLAANNDTVQQWNDQSGNGRNLSQATSANRPTYHTAGYNSLPAVQLNSASSTWLATAVGGLTPGAVTSVFVVFHTEFSSVQSFARLAAFCINNEADASGAHSACFILRDAGNNAVAGYQGNSEKSINAISDATNYRLGMVYDGTNANLYINNVIGGTITAAAPTFSTAGTLLIGADLTVASGAISAPGSFWNGPVAEILVVGGSVAPTSTVRNNIDTYFTTKWGV